MMLSSIIGRRSISVLFVLLSVPLFTGTPPALWGQGEAEEAPAAGEDTATPLETERSEFSETFELTEEMRSAMDDKLAAFAWRHSVPRDLASGVISLDESEKSRSVVNKLLESNMITGYLRYMLAQRKAGFALREKDYRAATRIWTLYRQRHPDQKKYTDPLLAILKRQEGKAKVRNLGAGINSTGDDYMPVPELSGRRIYFTNRDPERADRGEDIYVAVGSTETGWDTKALTGLNTNNSESPDGVSPDGNRLFLFGNYPGSLGRGDIFYSELTANGWSNVKPLPKPINSPYFDSDTFFTADGKAVLFASDRPGSPFPTAQKGRYHAGSWWGNTDLYVSFLQADGTYSLPRNLGPFLNTPGSERTPFLHPDGRTLYFSSDAYVGFGDMDIYKSVRLDDTWQRWSKPRHIGKVVNGSGTDWGFRLTAASDRGYFSGSLPGSVGGEDLFEVVPLPLSARPKDSVVALRGRVLDPQGKGLQARIECRTDEIGDNPGRLMSRPGNGEFYITLQVGKRYICSATRKGYVSGSRVIDLRRTRSFREEEVDITLVSLTGDDKTEIVLNNVLFLKGSARLTRGSSTELDRLAGILRENEKIKIEIQGHTDSVGNDTFNLGLSQKRAESVRDYLLQQGIDGERLKAKGYGESKPIDSNDTAAGRKKNRRVSFVVVK